MLSIGKIERDLIEVPVGDIPLDNDLVGFGVVIDVNRLIDRDSAVGVGRPIRIVKDDVPFKEDVITMAHVEAAAGKVGNDAVAHRDVGRGSPGFVVGTDADTVTGGAGVVKVVHFALRFLQRDFLRMSDQAQVGDDDVGSAFNKNGMPGVSGAKDSLLAWCRGENNGSIRFAGASDLEQNVAVGEKLSCQEDGVSRFGAICGALGSA